jgi:hypothetical protein
MVLNSNSNDKLNRVCVLVKDADLLLDELRFI